LEEILAMLEITTDPHRPGSGIGARRKNGDKIYLRGETIRQLRTVRKMLMKLSRHYGLPMIAFADFAGVEEINTTNEDLIECLSTVPDPYAGVDRRVAVEAWQRDWRICNRVLRQDPTIDQLLTVSGNQQDWMTWWRCNHDDPQMRSLLAEEIANAQELIMSNRARLAKMRGADGQQH
jgi:hypothetical protein